MKTRSNTVVSSCHDAPATNCRHPFKTIMSVSGWLGEALKIKRDQFDHPFFPTLFLSLGCLFPVTALAEELPFFVSPIIAESIPTVKDKTDSASFDITSGNLYLPSVEVPGLGLVEANLSWLAHETGSFQFILTDAVLTSNTRSTQATFAIDSGVLHIPDVQVPNGSDGMNSFQVDMQLIAGSNPLRFYITNIFELDHTELPGIYAGTASNTIFNCNDSRNNRTTISTGSIEINGVQNGESFTGFGSFGSTVQGFWVEERFDMQGMISSGGEITGTIHSQSFVNGQPGQTGSSSFSGKIDAGTIIMQFPEQELGIDNCITSGTTITVTKQ